MNQGNMEEAKRTFLTCAEIPDENLKDPHAHKSSVTSCLYNLGKLLHEHGQQEVSLFDPFLFHRTKNTQMKTIYSAMALYFLNLFYICDFSTTNFNVFL